MNNIKKLALKVGDECGYSDPSDEESAALLVDFATCFLAAYTEGQEPVAKVVNIDWQNQLKFLVNTPLATGTKLYTTPPLPAIPEGMVLVPRELSSKAWDAAWSAFGATSFEDLHPVLSIDHIRRLYAAFHKAMIAAGEVTP